jgi:vitamin B12 transporter
MLGGMAATEVSVDVFSFNLFSFIRTNATAPVRVAAFRRLALAAVVSAAAASAHAQAIPQLPETVVSASRVPVPSERVGSAVSVVTADEIERKQMRVLSDILRGVPGLAINRAGPAGNITQMRIRGAEGNQTLVIIDGIEVNNPAGESEFNFGTMLASDIERVEVLRGPQSALYGNDAVGGVIFITTKRGRGPAEARLSAEAGSFRTANGSASLRGGAERYHYSFGATGLTTDGTTVTPESEGGNENDGYRNQTYNVRVGATLAPNLDVSVVARHVRHLVETDHDPAVAGVIRTVDANNKTRSRQRVGRLQTRYALLDGRWEHALGVARTEDNSDSFTNGSISFEAEGVKDRYDYQTSYGFETPDFAAATHTVTLLADRERDAQVTRSAFGRSDLAFTHYGYAGEYLLGLWDDLFLSAGLRFDDNEFFDSATTYRLTAAHLLRGGATRLHASYGSGVKNPNLSELFGFGPNFVPNPNLRPEEGLGWDAGVERTLFGGRAILDVTYFKNRITDLIQGAGNTAVNLPGESKIDGIEVSGRAALTDRLALRGQYTFTDGQDGNRVRLVRRPKHLASATLSYSFLGNRAAVVFGADFNGEQTDFEFSNFFATRRVVVLNDYTLVSVAGVYRLTDRIELVGRIENLLNEKYENVRGFEGSGVGAFVGLRTAFPIR